MHPYTPTYIHTCTQARMQTMYIDFIYKGHDMDYVHPSEKTPNDN